MRNARSRNANTISEQQTIEELINRFERAQLEQTKVITELRSRIPDDQNRHTGGWVRNATYSSPRESGSDTISESASRSNQASYYEKKYSSEFAPTIGDKVRILNPRGTQHNRGTIRNFCRDGKVRVDTGEGNKLVDRTSNNIVFTTYPENDGFREQDGRFYYQR